MATTKPCNCGNETRNNGKRNNDTHEENTDVHHTVIGVSIAVGCIAVLVIVVGIWLTLRRRRLLKTEEVGQESELSDDYPNSLRTCRGDRVRVMSMTKFDMYGGSLCDLSRAGHTERERHLAKQSFSSTSCHDFLYHGNHNNTILNTLAATWSIQTLPDPPLPGDVVIQRVSRNPLYNRPGLGNHVRRCVSNNALYESVDNIFSGIKRNKNCRNYCSGSPAYQSIDELKLPSSITPKAQVSHYERVDIINYNFKTIQQNRKP
ncbi:uncharacterized protein LOC110241518 [Exaiptasia diaphana]|uniref:Uncharacterized protein n=1 Tax=Exaiptasia diaphana TaxID=2652724 RepID=A0A913XET2_EXADI|nr:uncharacterized protein LOC110241518 [Exaiptasia diaphana]XP_028515663.1 uncharacterized protein LOC110241518 [Exaiptasia diaphana]XP_028515665.1 uncharacterized protein LOC110241518 [Exaiptasia diaphana]